MSKEFFINEILEDEEAKAVLLSNPELDAKGKALADQLIQTGTMEKQGAGLLPLFILANLADATLALHQKRGIPREITVATLKDTNIWIQNYRTQFGELGLKELYWLLYHFKGEIFRVGRLQFRPMPKRETTPSGEWELEVHIPQGEPLSPEACLESFAKAKEFFAACFPEHQFDYFVCSSWLLSPHLANVLPETSNIVKFMRMWTIHTLGEKQSNAVVDRVFRFGMKREDLNEDTLAVTSMQKSLKAYLLAGGDFRDGKGYRKIDE